MFCPKCGTQLPDGSRFCASCGSQLGGAPAPAAAPQAGYVPPVQPIKPGITVPGLATNDLGMLVSVVSAIVGIVAFFMPIISLSVFGSTTTLSAKQMTFGTTVYGMSMDGEFANILFLVIPVTALVVSLLVKGKPGAIARVVVAVILLGFVFAWKGQVDDQGYGFFTMGIAFNLFVLSGAAVAVGGVLSLLKK